MEDLQVQSGAVIALRLFDIAYSIDLQMVETLWSQRMGGTTSRSRLNTAPPKAVAFDVPPVLLSLGTLPVTVENTRCEAAVTARLYDPAHLPHLGGFLILCQFRGSDHRTEC